MSLLQTGNLALKKAKSMSLFARLVINAHSAQTRLHAGSRRGFHLTSSLNKSVKRGSDQSPGPRYVQGPTLPALKLVVQALEDGPPQMLTKEEMEEVQKLSMSGKKKRKNGPKLVDDMIHDWTWELVPPGSDVTPIEQRESIPTQKGDLIWMKHLVLTEAQRVAYGVDKILQEANSRNIDVPAQDRTYGSVLAVKWQDRTNKDRTSALRSNEQSTISSNQTREIGVPFLNSSKKVEATNKPKPYLNPDEPEYRQSRKGANDIPLSLQDPRRRQYGFHYGLPKQKELLRAANAREYDQEEWIGNVNALQSTHYDRIFSLIKVEMSIDIVRFIAVCT
ncbi:15060_t:CDS:2 [Acaulospora colombiana]|uniref:15060_t:CDS:1 n=1 Tax=Acaulospora colombiana TaxID=27376 RepID=A0ACA9MV90_9GLOM|nr:15060_t:CDS:2 [Acaulospora colombiana]